MDSKQSQDADVGAGLDLASDINFLRAIVEGQPDFQIVLDRKFRFVYISRMQPGLRREDLIGKNSVEMTHPNDRARVQEFYQRVFDTEKPDKILVTGQTGPNKMGQYSMHVAPIFRPGEKKVEYILITARDVTEEWLSQEYYEYFWKHSPIMMHAINSEGILTHVSQKWLDTLGYASEEVLGRRSIEFLLPDAQEMARKEIGKMMKGVNTSPAQTTFLSKSGDIVEVELYANAVRDTAGHFLQVYAVIIDVTERNRRTAELIQAMERAVQSEKAKSQFLAVMNHELRTPLTSILSAADLLENEKGDAISSNLEIIKNSGKHLLQLVNEVLTLSKIEAGHLELIKIKFHLRDLVRDVASSCQHAYGKRGVGLQLVISLDIPNHFFGDPTRLRQILFNILSNAFKYTEQGQILVEISWFSLEQETLIFKITDSGIGIPPGQIDSVFRPFAQLDNGATRKYEGTGLGLAIVDRLVSLMGGKIELTSECGRGTAVTVTLPISPCDVWLRGPRKDHACSECEDELARTPLPAKSSDLDAYSELRVLIVEDNETNAILLEAILKRAGFEQVDIASDGQAAVTLAKRKKYDLVMLDLHLPDMDGFAIFDRIRDRVICTIACTADATDDTRQRCLVDGIDDIIFKPYESNFLLAKIRKNLAARMPHLGI